MRSVKKKPMPTMIPIARGVVIKVAFEENYSVEIKVGTLEYSIGDTGTGYIYDKYLYGFFDAWTW